MKNSDFKDQIKLINASFKLSDIEIKRLRKAGVACGVSMQEFINALSKVFNCADDDFKNGMSDIKSKGFVSVGDSMKLIKKKSSPATYIHKKNKREFYKL